MKRTTLREWQEKYKNGEFDKADLETQSKAGWYDWFCKDKTLLTRLKKLASAVTRLEDSEKINLDEMYVFFRNNCPIMYSTYDDFRICDIETGDVVYTVQRNNEANDKLWFVYGRDNNFEESLFSCDSVYELRDWFNQ